MRGRTEWINQSEGALLEQLVAAAQVKLLLVSLIKLRPRSFQRNARIASEVIQESCSESIELRDSSNCPRLSPVQAVEAVVIGKTSARPSLPWSHYRR